MKKKSLLFLLLTFSLFSPTILSAQRPNIRLSHEARVTLLTCSPGDELYSVFGHSAIRIEDPLNNMDLVFNYGTFDFSDPHFYTNFVRGKLNYILSVAEYRHFQYDYIMEERWIWEQELNIGHTESQHLFDSLLINYQPENRYYLYDFFFDNCATRIRDIFVEAIDHEIVFDYQVLEHGKSFRELLMPYLTEKPWARLGINLSLGLPADKTATPWDYMFLPDHMMTVFENARFNIVNGTSDFTPGSKVILQGGELPKASFGHAPIIIFLIVLFTSIILSYQNLQSKKISWWYDRILFGALGLLGLLISFLWFGTDHQVTVWNLNIFWAHPFHFVIIFFFSGKKNLLLLKYYFMINLTLLVLLILSWPLLPQALPWVIIPIVITMILRSVVILRILNPDLITRPKSIPGKN